MERAFRANDVRQAERPLLDAGEPLMERASYEVAQQVLNTLADGGFTVRGSTALILAGHGDNGADALFAGAILARRGMSVRAAINGSAHAPARKAAEHAGVRIVDLAGEGWEAKLRDLAFFGGTWIDGLVGIGASGPLRPPFSEWVRVLNEERERSPEEPTVIAVDVPSGVGVDDGDIPGEVLRADLTVAMGAAKPCHLLPPACHACGQVRVFDLGLDLLSTQPAVTEVSDADVRDLWIIPGVGDHKYTRGVLGMLTGSALYPGAAVLGVGGALATGPGMIRQLGDSRLVMLRHPEVVTVPGQVQAWVIGSGLDSLDEAEATLNAALAEGVPVVLDAAAIELAYTRQLPATVVLTPHAGELTGLLRARGEVVSRDDVERNPARAARRAAELTGATVVCKGNVDVVASPSGHCYSQRGATTWRGTAGSGDVYAGILGGLLAMYGDELAAGAEAAALGSGRSGDTSALGMDFGDLPVRLAAAASLIHLRGSNLAARAGSGTGVPISASKIVEALEEAIHRILNPKDRS